MPFCTNCGADYAKGERFCSACGYKQVQEPSGTVLLQRRCLKPLTITAVLLILLATAAALILLTGAAGRAWEKCFGGDGNEAGYCVIETDDGDYVVAGWTDSFGAGKKDVYLIKVDRKGRLVWEKSYGGTGDDAAYCIKETVDGGFIITGWTESFRDSRDIYLLKVDHAGNLEWEKTFGCTGNSAAGALLQAPKGGFIIAGWTEMPDQKGEKAYALAVDESGAILWERAYGSDESASWFNSIDHAYNDGLIMAGGIENQDGTDAYIVKTDGGGAVEWERIISRSAHDMINSIRMTSDGCFIMAGESISSVTGGLDVFWVKLDPFNNIEWELTLGIDGSSWGNAVLEAGDGGYVVAGEGTYHGTLEVVAYLAGVDSRGLLQWELTLGEESYNGCYSVLKTSSGDYVFAGSSSSCESNSNLYMVKLRP